MKYLILPTARPNASRRWVRQCASSKIISTGSGSESASNLRDQRFQYFLPALQRRQIERGIAAIVG